jgi:hypothetical protein
LNTSHPKIKIIDHKDIFDDVDNLPTFNSCSIETQLHHIKELSEHFIYFNDDMFVGNNCGPEFFFTKNGLPRIFVTEIVAFPNEKLFDINKRDPQKRNTHQQTLVNTRKLILDKFHISLYHSLRHGVKPLLKSKLFELENLFKTELVQTCKNSFRTTEDIIFIYLFGFWAIAKKFGKTKYLLSVDLKQKMLKLYSRFSKFTFGFINLHDKNTGEHLKRILKAKPTTFCLNQTPETPKENLILLKQFLEDYFPEKCEFEK